MVKLCENGEKLGFLPADPFAAKIAALFKTYGPGPSFASFWTQTVNSEPAAAIGSIEGNATAFCLETADFEELSEFINAAGFESVICREETARALGLTSDESSYILRFEGTGEADFEGISRSCDLKKICGLLSSSGFEVGDCGAFLADAHSRIKAGTANLAAIIENGEPLSCAFTLFNAEKSALLGAVATLESRRGRGLASRLVGALARSEAGKAVFLFCKNDSLAGFYERLGFKIDGKWTLAGRKTILL